MSTSQPALTDEAMLPDTGTITFTASHRPPLEDGEYVLTVLQSVKNKDPNAPGKAAFQEAYVNQRIFAVRGERFAIDSAEISSVFPPASSTGEYSNVLPHIVFNRLTLPWERTLGDENDSTWLALLLFDEDDPVPDTKTILAGDLRRAPFARSKDGPIEPSKLPSNTLSYPDLSFGYGEFPYQPCNAIDVPAALFGQVLPGQVDMPWLSHARVVTPTNPARMGLTAVAGTGLETSIVMGNRLPTPNARCTVHLVSLEGMVACLPSGPDYAPSPLKLPDGTSASFVRLVSLAKWSYTSVDPEQSFSGILKTLDAEDGVRVFSIANKSSGTTGADTYVANALHMGYAPLDHQTRQGSKTVSWYRGPFVPYAVPPGSIVPEPTEDGYSWVITTSDQAVRYDPQNGMMDISYAAAWQIGRLLALQDKAFSQALYEWKRQNTLAVVTAFERMVLESQLGDALVITAADHAARPDALHHALADFIRVRLKPHLARGKSGTGDTPNEVL